GHIEAVQVVFDPARISYRQLAARFLRTIDPTDSGGQFCDRGENYHTAIFALNAAQRRDAEAAVAEANRVLRGRVTTPVRGAARFYAAEAYHQDYARRNPDAYNRYRRGCGKDARLRAVWGNQAAAH
ncbi:MAG TPA: peptide-methionine (S)-S-oxide reductase, partial [Allosphingosinicella sp.]|nr:peptide-methionine (S)-S-oxide reductase [Allosphingosinicella sp.]